MTTKVQAIIDKVKTYTDRDLFRKELVGEIMLSDPNEELPEPFQSASDASEYADLAGDIWDDANKPEPAANTGDPDDCTEKKPCEPWIHELNLGGEPIKIAGASREEFIQNYSSTMRNRQLLKQALPNELDGIRPENYSLIGGRAWDKGHDKTPASNAAPDKPADSGSYVAEAKKDAKDGR